MTTDLSDAQLQRSIRVLRLMGQKEGKTPLEQQARDAMNDAANGLDELQRRRAQTCESCRNWAPLNVAPKMGRCMLLDGMPPVWNDFGCVKHHPLKDRGPQETR